MPGLRTLTLLFSIGAVLAGCRGKPEPERAAASQPASASLPTPPVRTKGLPIDLSALPVQEQTSATVAATAGGSLALSDGTRLELPPNAFGTDTGVVLRRLVPEPGGPAVGVTQIEAGGKELALPATLRVPLPAAKPGAAAGRLRAIHVHEGVPKELAVRLDPSGQTASIELRSFSEDVVFHDGDPGWTDRGHTRPTDTDRDAAWRVASFETAPRDPPLPLPFYPQGQSAWCWAAALQILLKAHGHDEEIWTLAWKNRSGFHEGLLKGLAPTAPGLSVISGELLGGIRGYFPPWLPVEHFKVPWFDHSELMLYTAARLREGHPVLIASTGHMVVAVGFNVSGLFVHDPSGFFLEMAANEIGRDRYADSNRLGAMFVTWAEFRRVCAASCYRTGAMWTMCVRDRQPTAGPVTLCVFPNDLMFWHPTPKPARGVSFPNVYFAWDGTAERGYRFCRFCKDIPKDYNAVAHYCKEPSHAAVTPLNATNSDKVRLEIAVANGSSERHTVRASATLGGKDLVRTTAPVTLAGGAPPWETNRKILVADGIALAPLGLLPGRHELRIHVEANGKHADSLGIVIDLGPSQVLGAKILPKDDKRRVLVWNAVAEQASGIEYEVWSLEGNGPPLESQVPVLVTTTRALEATLPADRVEDARWFAVSARHVESGIRGVPSDYVAPPRENDRPYELASSVEGSLTWVSFRSDAFATLAPNRPLCFRLLMAEAKEGPWRQCTEMNVSHGATGPVLGNGTMVDADRARMPGPSSQGPELTPPYWRVDRVLRPSGGTETTLASDVLAPSQQTAIRIALYGGQGWAPVEGAAHVRASDREDQVAFTLELEQVCTDQAFLHPDAHFAVEWNGKTFHCWSGRTEGTREARYSFGEAGKARLELPSIAGEAPLKLKATAPDGSIAERTVAVRYQPSWIDPRRAACATPIDQTPRVAACLAPAERIAPHLDKLESDLAKETDRARRRDIRREILYHEEQTILKLEEERVAAMLERAKESARALDWEGALLWYRAYLARFPRYTGQYAQWFERSMALDAEEQEAAQAQDAEAKKAGWARHREVMLGGTHASFLRGVVDAMKLARLAGDRELAERCFALLEQAHGTGKVPGGTNGGQSYGDLPWIRKQRAELTARLGADRELAAALLASAGSTDRYDWLPRGQALAQRPAPFDAEAFLRADQSWTQQTEKLLKERGIGLEPGTPPTRKR